MGTSTNEAAISELFKEWQTASSKGCTLRGVDAVNFFKHRMKVAKDTVDVYPPSKQSTEMTGIVSVAVTVRLIRVIRL